MVFGAVNNHNGYIDVDSQSGKGATFNIYIPLIDQDNYSPVSKDTMENHEGSGELILLVDDDDDVRQMGVDVLEVSGYKVTEASDGLNAIEAYASLKDKIALVIMDLVMPHLGGMEAAERILKINPSTKFIFVTGYDMNEEYQGKLPTNDSVILSKPFKINQLNKVIREMLDD